jgi:hypothetical protein
MLIPLPFVGQSALSGLDPYSICDNISESGDCSAALPKLCFKALLRPQGLFHYAAVDT